MEQKFERANDGYRGHFGAEEMTTIGRVEMISSGSLTVGFCA